MQSSAIKWTRSRSPGSGCGEGVPDFARMLTGTNSSRIISDTFGNKHLATMLVTRTDFEDVGDVGGYMSNGQKCSEKFFDLNIWRPVMLLVPTHHTFDHLTCTHQHPQHLRSSAEIRTFFLRERRWGAPGYLPANPGP